MHLLLSLVLAFQAGVRYAADPVCRPVVGDRNRPQPAVEDFARRGRGSLSGQFLRLTFRNEMPKTTFEGHAYYRPTGDGRYRGMWFDNSGMFRPLDARRDGDALVSKWGTPETEEGETTYRLTSDSRDGDRRSREIERWHVARIWPIRRDSLGRISAKTEFGSARYDLR